MARGKDAPVEGIQIDPYVQQSIMKGKEQAGSRLVAAMQEAGASERQRTAGTQAAVQTGMRQAHEQRMQATQLAAQEEMEDKRAAEAERARREDQKFAKSMQEATQEFRAKQAELDREQQKAIIEGDRKYKDEIEKRREALRRFNIELNMDAQERTTNAMLSIIRGGLRKESTTEKAKTVLEQEATRFDEDKDIYNKTRERVTEAINTDKRMDLPVKVGKRIPTGKYRWPMYGLAGVAVPITEPEPTADPMGVLQDQIGKYGGNISVEELAPENISKVEDQIQKGDIKTEDINKTIGVLEGMIEAVKGKRNSFPKESDEFDFWQDANLNMAQMRDDLEGLVNSTKKIAGSETETVGSRVRYALGTVHNSSLGGRAARYRDLVGGNFDAVLEEMSKPMQVPKLYSITPDMNKYDVEYRTWFNDYLGSRYPEVQQTEVDWGAD